MKVDAAKMCLENKERNLKTILEKKLKIFSNGMAIGCHWIYYRFCASQSVLAMWQHLVSARTRTNGHEWGRRVGFG